MKKLRIGKGTIGLYLAISALLPLAIYFLLSLQAQANHDKSAQRDQGAQVEGAASGAAAAGARPAGSATSSARPEGAWGDGKTSAGPPRSDYVDPPAQGAPYNWTFMAYSAVLMLIMLAFVLWLIRRTVRARDAET